MLARIFIKDYKNISDEKVRNKYGVLASVVGLIFNLILSAAKITAGIICASVAVVADGINNLTDAGSGVINILGFKFANKPADKEHPFGHARYEYIAGLIIAFIVIFFGIETVMSAIDKLRDGTGTEMGVLIWSVLGASILVKFFMFFYYRNMGKKISSLSLKAAATDSLNDCIATAVVLICSVIAYFTDFNTDGYAGIAVAVFILINGGKLVKETLSPLLGEKPSEELVKKIKEKALSCDGILGVHDLIIHNYGPGRFFVTIHLEVDGNADAVGLHEIVDGVERKFFQDGINLVAHMDPIITDERVDGMRKIVEEELKLIDENLSMHDFRVVYEAIGPRLLFDVVAPYDYKFKDKEIKDRLSDAVKDRIEKCTLFITVERGFV